MTQNRLANSSSAYLRSASHQPIDWYEFGEEAFQKAKELDRLVLLDIGAVWCHWCHVIDRESYENAEIAKLINENYIAVKVDRDQRPDIDARYQQVVQAMSGQGGWPLTAFLTYDGRLLYGGTYFPPHVMTNLLEKLTTVYQEQKADIMKDSLDGITLEEYKKRIDAAEAEEAAFEVAPEITDNVFDYITQVCLEVHDDVHGGFGNAPKFPHWSTLLFLMQQVTRRENIALIPMLKRTLTEMAYGGIYDQIGGGFHRYSVDDHWHVPHFEKMSYDNAEALMVYAQAYRYFEDPLYKEIAEGILKFSKDVLSGADGFYASQDADIDLNDDGDYFTWTVDEIKAALSEEDAKLVIDYYNVTSSGDMHERPGRNVLRIAKAPEALAQLHKLDEEEAMKRIATAKETLFKKRSERQVPYIDNTVYLNWNGMYISAFFEAADLLDMPEVRAYAQKTLETLLKSHVDNTANQLLHAKGVPGLLEDYAFFIQALLKGYQSTGEKKFLDAAKHWTDVACTIFEDTKYGGFFDTPEPTAKTIGLLKFRRKATEDTPSSSANGIMMRNLVQLNLLTDDAQYAEKGDKGFRIFGQPMTQRGFYASALATSLFDYKHPPIKLEVCGIDAELIKASLTLFSPGKLISYVPDAAQKEVRVCEGTRCLKPVSSVAELVEAVQSLQASTPVA